MSIVNSLKNAYISLCSGCNSLESVLLLLIRLLWGWLFFQTGMQKLGNIDHVIGFFQNLGIPFPEFNAHFVAWLETIGGICLMAGFATRLIAIPLIILLIVALLTAHIDIVQTAISDRDPSGVLKSSPFSFLFACLILLFFGPGKLSVDYVIEKLSGSKIEK